MALARRLPLSIIALLCVCALAGGAASPSRMAAPALQARPNIILVLTDDQELGSLAFMPQTRELIAHQGLTFSSHFVPLSLCCPSRATILTGLYPHNHKVYSNFPPEGGFERFDELGHEETTLATALHAAGYRTALLGKYLNGYPRREDSGHVPPGWDEWASPVQGSPYGAYRYTLNENGSPVKYGNALEDYMTDVLAGKATDFIRRASGSGQPFFLYLATYAPHKPATPAPRHAGLFPDLQALHGPSFNEVDVRDKPARIRNLRRLDDRQIAGIDALYRQQARSLQAVDEMVVGLVRALQETGQLANTYLFFTSDNGFHLGQHRLPPGKYTPYEPDVHVPLLVRGPGVPAGRAVDALTSSVDLAPTFAELAGATLKVQADGRSLVPLLQGQTPAAWRQVALLEQFAFPSGPPKGKALEPPDPQDEKATSEYLPHLGLRTADFKYVEYGNGEREVYDLRSDPDELANLRKKVGRSWLARLSAIARSLGSCAAAACREIESRPVPALPAAQ
ncbi:MAG TPA: sulfatase [Thermoanaerobaculia bacterium]|jgi:arylsulfatase A-like enzyme